MKYEKFKNSLDILDAAKPAYVQSKYVFKGCAIVSDVTDEELPFHTPSGKALQRLGWDMFEGFWSIVY